MRLLTEASGFLASITGFLLWLPQAGRVWRDRHDPARLTGVAVSTQVLSLAGNLLWGVHAIGIGSFWLGAPSVVNIPVAIMTIVVVRRARTVALAGEVLAETGVEQTDPGTQAPTGMPLGRVEPCTSDAVALTA